MECELGRFEQYSKDIMKLGVVKNQNSSSDFRDTSNYYRLTCKDGVLLYYDDYNFTSKLGYIYMNEMEDYMITLNKLDNKIIKVEKHTRERYGESYKWDIVEILNKIENYLGSFNANQAFRDKLEDIFSDSLYQLIPHHLTKDWDPNSPWHRVTCSNPQYQKEMERYKQIGFKLELEELNKKILSLKKYSRALSFIPYYMDIKEYGFHSLEEIRLFLMNTKSYKISCEGLYHTLGLELNIIHRDNLLALTCK